MKEVASQVESVIPILNTNVPLAVHSKQDPSARLGHIIKRLPSVPVPSGSKQGYLGASVPAVLAACPLNVVKASAVCAEGVFKAADGVETAPIARADLMKGFLVHSDEDGKPLAKGGPLRLAFPENVAVQSAICGTAKPPDLKSCVSLELRHEVQS